jgi:hypothetical protein
MLQTRERKRTGEEKREQQKGTKKKLRGEKIIE